MMRVSHTTREIPFDPSGSVGGHPLFLEQKKAPRHWNDGGGSVVYLVELPFVFRAFFESHNTVQTHC